MDLANRILLAFQQPETWAAMLSGAGVFGVPVGWLLGRLTADDRYSDGFSDGYTARSRLKL